MPLVPEFSRIMSSGPAELHREEGKERGGERKRERKGRKDCHTIFQGCELCSIPIRSGVRKVSNSSTSLPVLSLWVFGFRICCLMTVHSIIIHPDIYQLQGALTQLSNFRLEECSLVRHDGAHL